jgi:hypothetical protein
MEEDLHCRREDRWPRILSDRIGRERLPRNGDR